MGDEELLRKKVKKDGRIVIKRKKECISTEKKK